MIDKDGNGFVEKDEINSIIERHEIKRKNQNEKDKKVREDVDKIF